MKQAMPLIVMSVALCSAALAQTSPATPGSDRTYPGNDTAYPGVSKPATVSFDSLDKNKDGKVSKDEAKGNVAVVAAFDTADKNGDSSLSKPEFDAYFSMR